jgi:hypothetical protein
MLREAEVRLSQGEKIGPICRGLSISEQSYYYHWRRKYGGLQVTQAARLKSLEKENVRLRKAVSNLTLDALILKEVIEGLKVKASSLEPVLSCRPLSVTSIRPPQAPGR